MSITSIGGSLPSVGAPSIPGYVAGVNKPQQTSADVSGARAGALPVSKEASGVPLSGQSMQTSQVDGSKKTGKQAAPDAEELHKAVETLQGVVTPHAQELTFSVDKETGQTVIKLTDTATDTVVRQIPSEEALEMAKFVKEQEQSHGLLLNQKA